MNIQFRNRAEAGRLLAQKLTKYTRRSDVCVIALALGGVPLGYEIAQYIDAPLDLLTEDRPTPDFAGRTVILVSDGLASANLGAIVAALRQRHATRVAVAAPVIARPAFNQLSGEVDEVFALIMPLDIHNVSEWYIDFPAMTEPQARELLSEATHFLNESAA